MFNNYLKVAFRSLLKNPFFFGLNIAGLGLGLAVALLLMLHVRQELAFDRYHSKVDHVYRVVLNTFFDPTKPGMLANAPNAVAPTMKESIPAVEQSARLLRHEFGKSASVVAGDNKLVETKLFWADPSLIDILDVPVVAGDLRTALTQPNFIALSRSTAVRYFGTANPVGQIVKIDRMDPFEVKAVFEDFPGNSSMDINVLGAFANIKWANNRLTWSNSSFETWVLLNPSANRQHVEAQMAAMIEKNVVPERRRYSMWLQPLRDVHLYSTAMDNNYAERLGDPKQVSILGILALAVLLIACFNYMNLSTARAQTRFQEVGINKTMGATRSQLALRFYVETLVVTMAALVMALGLLYVGIPTFNFLADKNLRFADLFQFGMPLAAIAAVGGVVFLSGSYPAFFLSGFLPKDLFQTSFRESSAAGWVRRSLVTSQFAASVILIIGTIVLYRQMQYIQQKNLGFKAEQVLAVTTVGAESKAQLDGLMQEYRNLSAVEAVCRAQTYPGRQASGRSVRKSDQDENGIELNTNRTTPGIEKVLDIKLLAGAGLPEKQPEDTIVHVILTKTAIDYLGMTPEEAIGKKVNCDLGDNTYVAGVAEDMHTESLHKAIGAYAFHDAPTEDRRFLLVKLNTANLPETMKQVEAIFYKSLPQAAFEYKFLDDHLASLYAIEQRTARVMLVFSALSILVSCLGLFGLAAFAASERTKEIGIRKVLGASVANVTGLLTKDFLKLVLVSVIIATPVAYYLAQRWLSDFTYHIDLQWWMFAGAATLALLVATLTVGFQSVKAALVNPVHSLKGD